MENGTFKFRRAITGRNSFLPIIGGRIVQEEGGAVLRGTMRLHLFVAVFTAFWMAVTMTVAAQTLAQFAGGSGTAGYVLFVSLFPLFGGTLAAVRYYPERRKAMRLLVDAVQPELQSKT